MKRSLISIAAPISETAVQSDFSHQRRCALCDRVFEISTNHTASGPAGEILSSCPTSGCRSTPEMWVHPGNPLTSDAAWEDWERMSALWEEKFRQEDLAA
jgi:hypothetical protein